MKKVFQTMLCLTLVLALSIGMSAAVFAADNSQSDVSIDDILSYLSSLTDEDIGGAEDVIEEGEPEDASGTLTMGHVSFRLPEDMDQFMANEEELLMVLNSSFDSMVVATQVESGGAVDMTDEATQEEFFAMLTEEGNEVTNSALVSIQGNDALWVETSTDSGMEIVNSESIVLNLGNDVFIATISSSEDKAMDIFLYFLDSIMIEGANGETDISAITQAEPLVVVPQVGIDQPSAPAASAAEAIDATQVEEVVLLDDDICKVTMKKFTIPEDDNWYGFIVKMYVENKSDRNIWAHAENVCLNGYVLDPYWGESVASGHKSNSEMEFSLSDLEENNITDIGELSFRLEIDDDDDYTDLEKADFTVLPFGTNVPAQPAQTFSDDDIVLVDNDALTMIITGDPEATDYYLSLPIYIENRTDKNIRFSTYGASAINGYEISPSLYATVPAGKKINTSLSWYVSDLEENDIEAIEDVELDLRVSDDDDWSADPIFEDIIYFTLS